MQVPVHLYAAFLLACPFWNTMADTAELARLDRNEVPWDFPANLNTSNWPEKMPGLLDTHAKTKSAFWHCGETPEYRAYIQCLDELIAFYYPGRRDTLQTDHRRKFHRLLAKFYGYDFPPYKPEDKRTRKTDSKDGSGPECPAEHLRDLTLAAQKLEKQAVERDSAIWASEKASLVFGLGWDAIQPKDVVGLTALGLLQEAVKDRKGFFEKVLLQYAVKPKEKTKRKFSDDGSEQLKYSDTLLKRVRGKAAHG